MQRAKKKKVVVAMSGGVDSSVAAALLKQEGYEVVGCFMRLGSEDSVEAAEAQACDPARIKPGHQGCCSLNDASDARLVAAMLEVPFYVLNFKKDFGKIIDYFVSEYNAGRTPNPCVRCNDWLKFGKLAAYAESINADYIATGHYARIQRASGDMPARLLRGRDARKDQSYFLFGTSPDRLERMILPIGEMEKTHVRDLAQEFGLPVFNKPDSQEICFVPDNKYMGLIRKTTPDAVEPGDIVDSQGRVVGRHEGHQQFTIGQRRGVAVALGHPAYVVDKDPEANTIKLGTQQDLFANGLVADQANWLTDVSVGRAEACQVKIRHNSPAVPAVMTRLSEDTFDVRFDEPQRAVTPGQAAVCYRHEEVIGGGWITQAIQNDNGVCQSQAPTRLRDAGA